MGKVEIKNNFVNFSNNKWFVGNAETVQLGSGGEKATPFLGVPKLEVKNHLPPSKLDGSVRIVGPYELDVASSSKSDFNAVVSGSFKAIGLNVSGGAVFEGITTGKLKFIELFVEEEDMVQAVNQSPAFLDQLASFGAGGRVVLRQLVVAQDELASQVTAGGKVKVSAAAAGISLEVGGGSSASSSVTLTVPPYSCLCYLLMNYSWNRDKTQICNPRVDEHGIQ